MEKYILGVCGAVIISALVSILLPDGKTGKFINGILKLFCLLVMLLPLFSLVKEYASGGAGETGQSEASADISLDEDFISVFGEKKAEAQERSLQERIGQEYSVTVTVQIGWDFVDYAYTVSNVKIKIENFGMYGNDEHILVISKIRSRVSGLLNLSEEAVEVYE